MCVCVDSRYFCQKKIEIKISEGSVRLCVWEEKRRNVEPPAGGRRGKWTHSRTPRIELMVS